MALESEKSELASIADGRARVITVLSKFLDSYASVAITDTGVGVDPAISGHLFEALVCRSAEKSSMPMEGGYGWRKTPITARHSLSPSHFASRPTI
jgi:hypothetical protein